jgi:hypothetical protein
MLDRFTPLAHLLGMFVEPTLDGIENMLVLPTSNPALLARGASILDGAALADIRSHTHKRDSLFSRDVIQASLKGDYHGAF